MTKFEFIFFVVALLAVWRLLRNDINRTKGEIMAKVSELPTILNGIADRLDKSKTEILAEIETLKTSLDGDISPET